MDDAQPVDGKVRLQDEDGEHDLTPALVRRLLSDMRLRDRLRWCLVAIEQQGG